MIKKTSTVYIIAALSGINGCSLLESETEKVKHQEIIDKAKHQKIMAEVNHAALSRINGCSLLESKAKVKNQEPSVPGPSFIQEIMIEKLDRDNLSDYHEELQDQVKEASKNLSDVCYEAIQAQNSLEKAQKSGNERSTEEKLKLHSRAYEKAVQYARRSQIVRNDLNKCEEHLKKISSKKARTGIQIQDT